VDSSPFLSRLAYHFLIDSKVLGLACRIISIQESLTLLILVLAAYNQFQTQSGFYELMDYRVASSCTSQSSTYLFGGCTFLVLFISHFELSGLLVFSEILNVDLTVFSWLKKQKYLFFSISSKKIQVRIFLIIGVKQGKSSEMGEKIKRLNSESGQVQTK